MSDKNDIVYQPNTGLLHRKNTCLTEPTLGNIKEHYEDKLK